MLPLLPVEHGLTADDSRLLPLFGDPPRAWAPFDLSVSFSRVPFGLQRDPLEALLRGVHVADWLVDAIDPGFENRIPYLDVEAGPGKRLVIHPGAGGADKRWPEESFAAVAKALGRPLALIQGPADGEARIPGEVWRNLPLTELAQRLRGSQLFLGNDSGITHLAAALGIPTVALHLRTDPAIWGIRGPLTRRLAGANIPVQQVIAACRMA